MSGNGKHYVDSTYDYPILTAANILYQKSDYVYVEEKPEEGSKFRYASVAAIQSDPETQIMHKQLFEKLSEEAQSVVSLFFQAPSEITDTIMLNIKCRGDVRRYLKSKCYKRKMIDKIFKEINKYLIELRS